MDDIVGELRDCAADSAEVGYKSRAQVAMLRAADDIVALQGRIVRQCQSVNELVAATEKCIEERAALRARVAEGETYRKFWQRYAMPPKARPSCLVCGRAPEDWPPAIQHMALPSVIVCTPCVTAARAASNKPASLPEGK